MSMVRLVIMFTIGGLAILNAILFWFMPRLTRRDLYFAVTVAPAFRDEPEGRSILGRYRSELIFFSALALTAFVTGSTWFGVGFVSTGTFLQLGASFIAFYRARQWVLPHAVPPTMIREAELHNHDRIILGGWMTASGPFILLAACAGCLWIHRGENSMPTSSGHVNRRSRQYHRNLKFVDPHSLRSSPLGAARLCRRRRGRTRIEVPQDLFGHPAGDRIFYYLTSLLDYVDPT